MRFHLTYYPQARAGYYRGFFHAVESPPMVFSLESLRITRYSPPGEERGWCAYSSG
ncbi:MAG: hypothetical protein GY842_03510 [bacterium]|nr:hypothetical protein [bacterium]